VELTSLILMSELKIAQHHLLKVHRLRLQALAVVDRLQALPVVGHLQDLRQEPLVPLRLWSLAVQSQVRLKLFKPQVPLDARLVSP
jgi:hypothetical protein